MTGNTHFVFRHRVFSVDGSYFSSRKGGQDPCLNVPMGEVMATVAIPALRKEFDIADDSADGKLLDVVVQALKYLRVIRVSDAIPSELLDGSASWSVEDRHRATARCRLALALVNWATGKKQHAIDLTEFANEIDRPEVRTKIRDAIEKVAQRLSETDDAVTEAERRIARLEHELSYIEGLRERFQTIRRVLAMVDEASVVRGQGQLVRDEIERVRVLLSYAFTRLGSEFDLVDKQQQDVLPALSDVIIHVQLIRDVRDAIHYEMMMWDEIVDEWRTYESEKTDGGVARMLEKTYQFLAKNYAIAQVW